MTYRLDDYLPDASWFVRPSRLHGIGHTTRVLVWTAALIDCVGTEHSAELLTAAMVHDTQRHDDGVDREHGWRAAVWVLSTFPRLAPERTADRDLGLVARLCAEHNTSDRYLPFMSPDLALLKDADALDRARLGDLDPRRLRHAEGRALIASARHLYERTRAAQDAATVRAAALDLGVWR